MRLVINQVQTSGSSSMAKWLASKIPTQISDYSSKRRKEGRREREKEGKEEKKKSPLPESEASMISYQKQKRAQNDKRILQPNFYL